MVDMPRRHASVVSLWYGSLFEQLILPGGQPEDVSENVTDKAVGAPVGTGKRAR